jgi:glycosyltransferase involved in cell wall biosynthesis
MAVKSAFEQDYSNIEVIVIDNASTDDSQSVLSCLQSKYNFVFEINDKNIGMVPNFNRCMDLAKGEYIVFLSSDDLIKPQFVSKCLELFSADNVGMVVAHCDGIDQQHKVSVKKPFFESSGIISGQEHARIFMMTGIYFPSQVLIKKSTLQDVGGWNTRYPIFFDWYLWFCI